MNSRLKVTIIGWFGSGNGGDEAVLISELKAIQKLYPKSKVKVVTFSNKVTRRAARGISIFAGSAELGSKGKFFSSEFGKIKAAIGWADVVLIGGGGMLQDAYNWFTVPTFCTLATYAKLRGKKTVFYCVGAGPMSTNYTKLLVKYCCNTCDFVSVRNMESAKLLAKIGVNRDKIIEAVDPAFYFGSGIKTKKTKDYIGVSVREVKQWHELNDDLADFLIKVSKKYKAPLYFIPVGQYSNKTSGMGEGEPDDADLSRKIIEKINKKSPGVASFKEAKNIWEIFDLISQAKLMVGMRFHALVFAAENKVPLIGISYPHDTKIPFLLKQLGLSDRLFYTDRLAKAALKSDLTQDKNKLEEFTAKARKTALALMSKSLDTNVKTPPQAFSAFGYYVVLCFGSAYMLLKTILARSPVPYKLEKKRI